MAPQCSTEGYALKGWLSATSWAGTLHGGPSWASGTGSHHLSGAASMLALVCLQPQGVWLSWTSSFQTMR